MYILIAVVLVIAAVIAIAVPDPLPMVEEIILVATSILSFVKGISDTKKKVSPQDYIDEEKKTVNEENGVADETVYAYRPPTDKSKTPKGYPKYDKNNPDAVYYYKK